MNLMPNYEHKSFISNKNNFTLIASGVKQEGVMFVNQNIQMLELNLEENQNLNYKLKQNHIYWLHIISGAININNTILESEHIIAVDDVNSVNLLLNIKSIKTTKAILIEMLKQYSLYIL